MDELVKQIAIPKFILCLIGAITLSTFYLRSKRRSKEYNQSKSRVAAIGWIAIVVINWTIMDLMMIFYHHEAWYWFQRSYVSTLNNTFILFFVTYLDHNDKSIIKRWINNGHDWKKKVIYTSMLVASLICVLQINGYSEQIYFIPDYIYNVVVVYFFGSGVKESFVSRGLKSIAFLGYVPFILISLLVFPFGMFDYNFVSYLIDIQSSLVVPIYVVFIFIFISFSIIWTNEGFRYSTISSSSFEFVGEKKDRKFLLSLMIPGHIPQTKVWLSKANYGLVHNLAKKRKDNINGGWVLLESDKEDQFYFHKQFSRVSKELNVPISEIFENDRSGRYRLNCNPTNIIFENNKVLDKVI